MLVVAAVLLLGALAVAAQALDQTRGPQRRRAPYFFKADPNASGSLRPWDAIETGAELPVFRYPLGVRSPGVIVPATDPLRQQGKVIQDTVTPLSNFVGGVPGSDWAAVFNPPTRYYGQSGQEDWVHFRVMFPRRAYRPTSGEWNWFFESHDDSGWTRWYAAGQIQPEVPELAIGVDNDPGTRPQLFMHVRGGQDTDMHAPTAIFTDRPLRRNHWYGLMLHVIWSADPQRGLVQWWIDGKRVYSHHLADLWQRPDGSYDHVNVDFNNYRQHASWNSTVYYGVVEIGPTQASVVLPRR